MTMLRSKRYAALLGVTVLALTSFAGPATAAPKSPLAVKLCSSPRLVGLSLSRTSITSQGATTGVVRLNCRPRKAVRIALAATVVSTPKTVTVARGSLTKSFRVSAPKVSVRRNGLVKASLAKHSYSKHIAVTPPPIPRALLGDWIFVYVELEGNNVARENVFNPDGTWSFSYDAQVGGEKFTCHESGRFTATNTMVTMTPTQNEGCSGEVLRDQWSGSGGSTLTLNGIVYRRSSS